MSEPIENHLITPEQLRKAGTLLYGQSWQTDFARAINVDPRRVRQWLSGDRPIPIGLWQEIIQLLRDNSKAALNYADELNKKFEKIKVDANIRL